MTSASALTPQRARDLGRTLAHRLVPLPQHPAALAESASLALLSLLPIWLPPGEEGTAAALRQLVRQDCFSTFLQAPAAAGGDEAAREELQRQLRQTFAEPLQPLLLLFSEACREALRSLPASRQPQPASASEGVAVLAPDAAAVAPPMARAGDGGSLLGLALAAAACFGFGWLGYQLTQGLGRSTADGRLQEPLAASPRAGVAVQPAAPPASGIPAGKLAVATGASAGGQAPLSAPLACLVGGQREIAAPADPSNYGPRLAQDWQGRPVPSTPSLIVLHETVVDEDTALSLFRRRHSDDGQQASYHVLIGRDGRRLRVVPDAERAFGAGDSQFAGLAVQLKPGLRPSVNNIALHVSLVSPADGSDGEAGGHSGYTPEQYRSLATQIALWQASYRIQPTQVVTHQEVDRSGSRRDPRSLDWAALGRDLRSRWLACGGSPLIASRMAALRQGPGSAR